MDYKDFTTKLQLLSIPTECIEACEEFVMADMEYNQRGVAHNDLGYAELRDITSKAQSIQAIVNMIHRGTCNYDSMGRDISKKEYKNMCANPSNGLKRLVLKSYYLHYLNLDVKPTKVDVFDGFFDINIESLYRLNAFKGITN